MNPTTIAIMLCGAAAGLSVGLVVAALVPGRPDLLAALTGSTNRPTATISPAGGPRVGRWQQFKARCEAAASRLPIHTPDTDLAVTGTSRGGFLATRIAAAAGGLVIIPAYTAFFAVAGIGLPLAVPALVGVMCGVIGWVAVARATATKAESMRVEMRHALVAYLQLVALYRAAGHGVGSALDTASATSTRWPFRRIASALASTRRAGLTPWQGLSDLADGMGITELSDLAAIMQNAADHGATVYATLLARADSLRTKLAADDTAAAAIASARMAIPKAVLAMATMAFLLYPAIAALTNP